MMGFSTSLSGTYWKITLCILGFLLFNFSGAEESFKCPEQFGYYPDYQDCSKYYVCVFGDSLHEKCTGGLFFSVELQTCDWPRNVECANGQKPGEEPASDFDTGDDEIFSSSRRTSATSNRPRPPNSEPVSNYQPFDTNNEQIDYQRNNVQRSQENQRTRSSSAATPNPELSTKPSNASPAKTTRPPSQLKPSSNPSTLPDRNIYNADSNPQPTLPEDPLYHGDERSKVLDPLDNYDPQQPDFDEAAPPLVDSEGGIHIADGGHGLDAFGGLSHLPGLGDYSVIAKPIYNANNGKAEDSDYKTQDQRKSNNQAVRNPTAVSTKPRSRETFQSNNGRSKDPDVVIDYSDGNKEISWREPQGNFGTPPPTIFDDNADHRDYGRFDIITPLKTNIQADHDPKAGLDRVKIPSEANDDPLPLQDSPRQKSNERSRSEIVRSNKVPSNENQEEHVSNTDHNLNSNSNRPLLHDKAHSLETERGISRLPSANDEYARNNRQSNRNTEYGSTFTVYDHSHDQSNDRSSRNFGNIQDTNTNYNRRPDNIQNRPSKSDSQPQDEAKYENRRTSANEQSNMGTKVENRALIPYQNYSNNNNPLEFQRQSKNLNQGIRSSFSQIMRNNKNDDTSIIEEPIDADFGAYTGNQRQNRKLEINSDDANSKAIIPAESIQPAIRQPNQIRPTAPKDRRQKGESEEPQRKANPYGDGFEEVRVEYGEYDSPKPHFTDDYYTNHEDQEVTTRSTTQIMRTRPTRPRRPITTTTTTTTTTTPAPIRVRSRRPISQVTSPTGKPNYVATTPASPPYRPQSLYPTPPPYQPTQKCDPRKCKLPDCRCGGTDIPGGLSAEETPQIVVLTFDDAVNDLNHDLYNELFDSGRINPNGCPILATFYVSHEWTDYGQVQTLYSKGHEIASHSITHSYGEKFSKNQWMREINGQREILHLYGGVKMEDIRGMRAPFLQIGGNKMFEMLYDANFTYDSSMPVYENNPPFWPYTLDYALNHECMIFPCPNKNYPGLWEVGMVMWVDLRGGRCSMGDACSNPPDEEAVSKMLMKNFNRHYKSNKAPFGLFYHSAWFNTQHHRRGFIRFLDEILSYDDVYLVTNWQLIQWMRDPAPISKMKDFEPFNCRKMDRPPPCPTPTVCNVWYQGGVRYMKSCQPCPAKYPWVGNTGFDNRNRG